MTELWHPVRHYEELYHVSSYGRVKALRKRVRNSRGHRWLPERVLSIQEKRGSGHGGQDYLYVALYGRSFCASILAVGLRRRRAGFF